MRSDRCWTTCWCLATLVLAQGAPARAEILVNQTGLANPAQTVTFDEVPTGEFQPVTDEFAGLGVTFSAGVFAGSATALSCPCTGFEGTRVAFFSLFAESFAISFAEPVSEAAFATADSDSAWSVAAELHGTLVEEAEFFVPSAPGLGFLNLQGIVFDRIVVRELFGTGSLVAFGIDTLQFTPAPLSIAVDVRPGAQANRIHTTAGGVVPVVIFGSEGFDVADVDASTLAFGPGAAPLAHGKGPHPVDLDRDGRSDLLAHFPIAQAGITPGDEGVCVSGELLDGTAFEGCDAITTVPPQ